MLSVFPLINFKPLSGIIFIHSFSFDPSWFMYIKIQVDVLCTQQNVKLVCSLNLHLRGENRCYNKVEVLELRKWSCYIQH
jgi:hypothetical protein